MQDSANLPSAAENTAAKLLADDRHFIGAVTALGDHREVVATRDIVAGNGVLLVAKGAKIDSRLRSKLQGHALSKPIDQQLSVEQSLTPEDLAIEASRQLDDGAFWRHLAQRSGDPAAIRHGLASLRLPEGLGFRLTVMQDQRPRLFQHSIRVAMLAQYLALRLRIDARASAALQIAALAHDLGELHTDPAILDQGHRVDEQERRFIYAHPVSGYLVLRDMHGAAPTSARAVLHHHERLDGSGYPSGISGEQIEPLARLLMIADTAESVMHRFGESGRLSALLRLSQRKYDVRAIAVLHDAIQSFADVAQHRPMPSTDVSRLDALAAMLVAWQKLRQSMADDHASPLLVLGERMQQLNSLLYQFGFDPASLETLVDLAAADAEIASELSQVLDELRYQLQEIRLEMARRPLNEADLTSDQMTALVTFRERLESAIS